MHMCRPHRPLLRVLRVDPPIFTNRIRRPRPVAKGAAKSFEATLPDAPSDMRAAEIAAALSWIERVVLR